MKAWCWATMWDHRYGCYVGWLRDGVLPNGWLTKRMAAKHRSGYRAVYVGQSALPPEWRWPQHLSGYKGSRKVRRFGRCLAHSLMVGLERYATRAEAERMERRLAAKFAKAGLFVVSA